MGRGQQEQTAVQASAPSRSSRSAGRLGNGISDREIMEEATVVASFWREGEDEDGDFENLSLNEFLDDAEMLNDPHAEAWSLLTTGETEFVDQDGLHYRYTIWPGKKTSFRVQMQILDERRPQIFRGYDRQALLD